MKSIWQHFERNIGDTIRGKYIATVRDVTAWVNEGVTSCEVLTVCHFQRFSVKSVEGSWYDGWVIIRWSHLSCVVRWHKAVQMNAMKFWKCANYVSSYRWKRSDIARASGRKCPITTVFRDNANCHEMNWTKAILTWQCWNFDGKERAMSLSAWKFVAGWPKSFVAVLLVNGGRHIAHYWRDAPFLWH